VANSDYTISFTGGTLSITPATLAVSADAQAKVYGAADPALTFVATAFAVRTVVRRPCSSRVEMRERRPW
jgi:hypothetical protein